MLKIKMSTEPLRCGKCGWEHVSCNDDHAHGDAGPVADGSEHANQHGPRNLKGAGSAACHDQNNNTSAARTQLTEENGELDQNCATSAVKVLCFFFFCRESGSGLRSSWMKAHLPENKTCVSDTDREEEEEVGRAC